MSSNQKIKLQALRIPPGWTVDWNTFYEVDAEEGREAFFEGSSLLQMSNIELKKIIDLEWRPESDLNGCYQLRVINFIENYNPKTHQYDRDTDWEAPHLTFSTRSRLKLVQKLEELFISLPPTLDERIQSRRGVVDQASESLRLKLLAVGPSEDLVIAILENGNAQVQHLLLDHPDVKRQTLNLFLEEGHNKGVKNKARQKLRSEKFKP